MNDENQPKVRFKGFTDPWEQCKFNQLYIKNTERNGNKFESNRTISISKMKYKTAGNGAAAKSISNYKVLRVGDIAFEGHSSNDFSYGRFVLNDVGDGIMSPRFTTLRPKVNTNIQFWKYYIHYEPIMRRKLVKSTKLGTMMNELVTSDLFKQSITVPTEKEANKIGACLQGLSNLIAANQDKLDQLKEVKKLLMQKIFDQQWRFSGFTDPWEQRKLIQVLKVNSGRDYKHLQIGDVPVYGTGGYMLSVSESLSNRDAIGIGRKGTINAPQFLRAPFWTVDTLFYMIPEKNFDLSFVYSLCETINWKKYDESTGVPSLSKKTIESIKVSIPMQNEQEKIGDLFSGMDYLIAANQDKVDQLKEMKKWLMQNMFV